MKTYPNYTLQEKINILKECPIENAPEAFAPVEPETLF